MPGCSFGIRHRSVLVLVPKPEREIYRIADARLSLVLLGISGEEGNILHREFIPLFPANHQ